MFYLPLKSALCTPNDYDSWDNFVPSQRVFHNFKTEQQFVFCSPASYQFELSGMRKENLSEKYSQKNY